jgi:chaperone modulatory protein CbpM
MRNKELMEVLAGEILEEEMSLTLAELCRACDVHAELIMALVEEGVLEPRGRSMSQWSFPGSSLRRVRVVMRLQRDLGVNLSGAALALELMEEIETLRARLEAVKQHE